MIECTRERERNVYITINSILWWGSVYTLNSLYQISIKTTFKPGELTSTFNQKKPHMCNWTQFFYVHVCTSQHPKFQNVDNSLVLASKSLTPHVIEGWRDCRIRFLWHVDLEHGHTSTREENRRVPRHEGVVFTFFTSVSSLTSQSNSWSDFQKVILQLEWYLKNPRLRNPTTVKTEFILIKLF